MARKRIVSIQTSNERGGAEYANVDLLDALAARGHDVVLLTNMPGIAAGSRVSEHEIDLGPKLARRTVGVVALRLPWIVVRLARALRAERPSAVLLHFKKEQLLCSLLPRRLTGRIVWAEWGPVPPPMRHGLARRLYASAARRASSIVAVSEGTRRTVIAAGVDPRKVVVAPNLIDVEAVEFDSSGRAELRSSWGADEDTFVIGCVSRFHRRKRNDVAIDAMAHIEGKALLVMAGEGDEEAALRERAAAYGDRVRFVPNVRGHVERFLSACDLVVFAPSPTEGAPRAIVMAQLVGIPVVATDREGAEGLIPAGAGTIVSPAHDPRALARAVESYRLDPERRRREGQEARRFTRAQHDPEQILGVFERALGLRSDGLVGSADR